MCREIIRTCCKNHAAPPASLSNDLGNVTGKEESSGLNTWTILGLPLKGALQPTFKHIGSELILSVNTHDAFSHDY